MKKNTQQKVRSKPPVKQRPRSVSASRQPRASTRPKPRARSSTPARKSTRFAPAALGAKQRKPNKPTLKKTAKSSGPKHGHAHVHAATGRMTAHNDRSLGAAKGGHGNAHRYHQGSGLKEIQQVFSWSTKLCDFTSYKGIVNNAVAHGKPLMRFLCTVGSPFYSFTGMHMGDGGWIWYDREWMPKAVKDIAISFEEYRITKFHIRFVPVSRRNDHRGTLTALGQDSIFERELEGTDATSLSSYPGSEERSPLQSFGNQGLVFNAGAKLSRGRMQIIKLEKDRAMLKSKINDTLMTVNESVAGIMDIQMDDVNNILQKDKDTAAPADEPMTYAVWIDATIQLFQFTGRPNQPWEKQIGNGNSLPEVFCGRKFMTKICQHGEACFEISSLSYPNPGYYPDAAEPEIKFTPKLINQNIKAGFEIASFAQEGDCLKPLKPGRYKVGINMHLSQCGRALNSSGSDFEAQSRPDIALRMSSIDVKFSLFKKKFTGSDVGQKVMLEEIIGIEGQTAWSGIRVNNDDGQVEPLAPTMTVKPVLPPRLWPLAKTYCNVDTHGVVFEVTEADVNEGNHYMPAVFFKKIGWDTTNEPTAVGSAMTRPYPTNRYSFYGPYTVAVPVLRVDSYQLTLTRIDNYSDDFDADFLTMDTLREESDRYFQRTDTFQYSPQIKEVPISVLFQTDVEPVFPGVPEQDSEDDSTQISDSPSEPEGQHVTETPTQTTQSIPIGRLPQERGNGATRRG